MDPKYQPFLAQIDALKYKIRDAIDHPEQSEARALDRDIDDLISDLRTNKHPRNIEDNIKVMQNRLRVAHTNPNNGFMSVEDADYFHRILEDMRMKIRQLPHY